MTNQGDKSMTRRPLILAAALSVGVTVVACGPTPQTNGRQVYVCDAIHMPGNELGWCMNWTRPNGMQVTGPVSQYNFEKNNPGVVYP